MVFIATALNLGKKNADLCDLQQYEEVLRDETLKNRYLLIVTSFKILNTFFKVISEMGKW